MDIETLLDRPNTLPSAPKIVQELITSFNDEHVSTEGIARKLAADPVLSAKLLRLANSAYYRSSRSINTVYDYAVVGAELASRWEFPQVFSDSIRVFPKPLEHQPFNPMAAIIHLAAWFSRINEKNLAYARTYKNIMAQEAIRADYPLEVATKLGVAPHIMLDKMPSLSALSNGLDELVA